MYVLIYLSVSMSVFYKYKTLSYKDMTNKNMLANIHFDLYR